MIYKRNRTVCYIIRFLVNVMFTMPIWISYYQGYLNAAQISILIAAQIGVQTIFEIPSGAIADMLGRKNTISVGILLGAISILLVPFATQFWQFLFLISLRGVMDALISGAEEALLYDSLKQDKVEATFNKVFSKAYIILQSGLLVGAFLGGYLYSIDKTLPYYLDGLALLIAFVASLFYIEPKIDSEVFSWKAYKKQFRAGIRESFKNPLVAKLSLYFIAVGGITWASQTYFNIVLLTDIIPSDIDRGMIQATIRFINIILLQVFVAKSIFSKTSQKIKFFPIVMVVAYLPGIFLDNYLGVPFVYLATLASTFRWVYMSEIINPHIDSKYRATAISTVSMIVSLINIGLYLFAGVIIPLSSIGVMYSLLGVLTVLVVVPIAISTLRHEANHAKLNIKSEPIA